MDDIEDEEEQDEEERADSDDERQKKKKRKKKSVFHPHVFLPLLVIEVDEFVCLQKKTECLIIDKYILLNRIYLIITLASETDRFSSYKTFYMFLERCKSSFFRSSMHMGWFLSFSPFYSLVLSVPLLVGDRHRIEKN